MIEHSSCEFGDQFSGLDCESEKCSHIGTCIRHNFTPWTLKCKFCDVSMVVRVCRAFIVLKMAERLFYT